MAGEVEIEKVSFLAKFDQNSCAQNICFQKCAFNKKIESIKLFY